MIYKSQVANFPYSDRLTEDINIANVEFLRRIEIEYNGTLTATGGTTDGTLQEDGLLNTILNNILFTADGSDRFVNTNGRNEYFRRAVLSGSPGVEGSVMPTGEASTPQRVHVVIDFDGIATAATFAGRINARKMASLSLRIETAQVEVDMVTGGDRAEAMTGIFEVYAVWDDGQPRAPVGAEDAFRFRGGARRIAEQRYAVTAANVRADLDIPTGLIIPHILFLVVDNDLRDNDLLNNVEIRMGENDQLRDVSFQEIQSSNVERFGLALASGLPPYAGIGILDFDLDGDMHPAKLLNTVGVKGQAAKARLNVGSPTGTAYVDMLVYGIDPRGVGK